jgi:chemotaxis protein MotB
MRRKPEEEHENHERWLVSYADFITLLFAFFVVMYAISSVNEGQYRVLSDSLSSAFKNVPGQSVGALTQINPAAPAAIMIPVRRSPQPVKADEKTQVKREKLRNMANDINKALSALAEKGQVKVTEGAMGITVDINASVLFAPGEAALAQEAVRALFAVAQVMAQSEFPITVEGHTDTTPISTTVFPSNWELSGARAASVVKLFMAAGVDGRRLSATGYADQRPLADNATPDGRQANRRVAITIESRVPDNPTQTTLEGESGAGL